ncbi:hypothetical protein [Halogranum rubrum]|uniref:Uncharacterized protein n=1 Tax=Halogranum salarium B-1 TaxID=1210908 RepID=J2ZF62_9EURY|nr:hypothetical protein [Halogranum salarium]EJN59330.1 hypothetical protein HSB1_27510 [Halogranum salarium B-1]
MPSTHPNRAPDTVDTADSSDADDADDADALVDYAWHFLAVFLVAFPLFYALTSFLVPDGAPPWLLVFPLLATVPATVWCRRREIPRGLLWSFLLTVQGLAIPLLVAGVLVGYVVGENPLSTVPADVLLLSVVAVLYAAAWLVVSRDSASAH